MIYQFLLQVWLSTIITKGINKHKSTSISAYNINLETKAVVSREESLNAGGKNALKPSAKKFILKKNSFGEVKIQTQEFRNKFEPK